MPACDECNRGTSTADLVAAVVSRWNYNNTEAASADHTRLIARVRKIHPDFINEWTKLDAAERTKARVHLQNHGVQVPADAGIASIGPLTIKQLNLFAHKVVLALYFEHFRTPVPNNGAISAYWRSKEDFAKDGIPQVLLDIMRQYGTLEQGKWNAREIFEYRYETNAKDGLFMCLARLRGSLFITGFAVSELASVADDGFDWVKPTDLLGMLNHPRFEKKA